MRPRRCAMLRDMREYMRVLHFYASFPLFKVCLCKVCLQRGVKTRCTDAQLLRCSQYITEQRRLCILSPTSTVRLLHSVP